MAGQEQTREPAKGSASSTSSQSGGGSAGSASAVQLKQSLSGQPFDIQMKMLAPVQKKGGGEDTAAVHEAAAAGVAGGGGQLPHADRIQAAFGRHDISGIQAHTGANAAKASAAMGAEAYATGDQIAFKGAPDLHTAAHEAAHVVQQQAGVSLAGGVGKAGDNYEQHADRVADKVVRGESAEGELDKMSGGGRDRKIQRKAVQHKAIQMEAGKAVDTLATPATDAKVDVGKTIKPADDEKKKINNASVESPTSHPMWPTFEARINALFAAYPPPSGYDVKIVARNIWSQVCGGVDATEGAMKRDGSNDTYSNPGRGWVNMESAGFKKAMAEFDGVMATLKQVTQAQFMKAKTFGFWSKPEGRQLAEKASDLTLETSGIGGLFDGLPSLDAHANGWDPQLWGSLSNAYGEAVANEMTKAGKSVHVFAGGGTDKSNVFGAIESKALAKGAQRIGKTLEQAVTFHAVAAKTKSDRTVDTTQEGGSVKGTWYSGHSWDDALKVGGDKFAALPEQ